MDLVGVLSAEYEAICTLWLANFNLVRNDYAEEAVYSEGAPTASVGGCL